MRDALRIAFAGFALAACGDDGGNGGGDLFPPKPECMGVAISALQGVQPQVIYQLGIGGAADGFDLDNDGKPDNKLAAVGSIAKSAIDDSLANYSIVIPMEFFDLDSASPDTCVKFAIYLGAFDTDTDGDGKRPGIDKGDCNEHDGNIHPGAAEVPGNFKDDDCDGLADEDANNNPSNDTMDRDGDGVSVKDGDCDDTDPTVHKGAMEICGDGKDNDCDGVADRGPPLVAGGPPQCSPFDPDHPLDITLDPKSFVDGEPAIAFKDGVIAMEDGKLVMHAGPSIFSVNIPVTDGINLDLRITGASIKADVVQTGDKITFANGHLGGVIDAHTADTIRGLKVDQIGLTPENSLLDATFANLLGPLLALPKSAESIQKKYAGCRTPDIDVDQDGLESYCDSDPNDDVKVVDVCIDGNGTEFTDVKGADGTVTMQCSEAQKDGKNRFVDGISVELNFATTPVKSLKK